jgi:hypothetical protein
MQLAAAEMLVADGRSLSAATVVRIAWHVLALEDLLDRSSRR